MSDLDDRAQTPPRAVHERPDGSTVALAWETEPADGLLVAGHRWTCPEAGTWVFEGSRQPYRIGDVS